MPQEHLPLINMVPKVATVVVTEEDTGVAMAIQQVITAMLNPYGMMGMSGGLGSCRIVSRFLKTFLMIIIFLKSHCLLWIRILI